MIVKVIEIVLGGLLKQLPCQLIKQLKLGHFHLEVMVYSKQCTFTS